MSYLSEGFNPPREFWGAMTDQAKCPHCGFELNGTVKLWELLERPVDYECNKCHGEWSAAIPLGECNHRNKIESLLAAERRFYQLRDQLREIIEQLHGRDFDA